MKSRSKKIWSVVLTVAVAATLLVIAAPAPSKACGMQSWYLPEGYTGGNFDTYILIQNPNDWEAEAKVRFLTPEGPAEWRSYPLEKHSRTTIKVDEVEGLADAEVSTQVCATSGVVVERAMYFNYEGVRAGGSNSIGANRTSNIWFLAEGYTGGNFDTYYLLMNPNENDVRVKVKYVLPQYETARREANPYNPEPEPAPEPAPEPTVKNYIEREYTLPALKRTTIHLDEIVGLESTDVSGVVQVLGSGSGGNEGCGIVAERAMYFDYFGVDGGHCSIGAPAASNTWFLPEGRTAGEFDTYVLVLNPNEFRTRVRATFMVPPEGGTRVAHPYDPEPAPDPEPEPDPDPEPAPADNTVVKEYTLEAGERFTIAVDQIPELAATDVGTMIESFPAEESASYYECGAPVVVERSMYFAGGDDGDGHNAMGAVSKYEYCLMAEGYTGGAFNCWVLMMNPNDFDVRVEATYMVPPAAAAAKREAKPHDPEPAPEPEPDPAPEPAEPFRETYVVRAKSRLTIPVDEVAGLADAEVSVKLQVLGPADGSKHAACEYGIVAERAMYFTYNGVMGGHCSMALGE